MNKISAKQIEKVIEELEILKNTVEKGREFSNFTTSNFDGVRAVIYNKDEWKVTSKKNE